MLFHILQLIPPQLAEIGLSSFKGCYKLNKVEFMRDSKLKTIEKFAFVNSNIRSISIPSHLTKICGGAFSFCYKLEKVFIPADSELEIIEDYAFNSTSITNFFFPPKIKKIHGLIFTECTKLQITEIDERADIKTFKLNSFIEHIDAILMVPVNLSENLIELI